MTPKEELDALIGKYIGYLPNWAQRFFRWLRDPSRLISRICFSILLILGGFMWFLPILGFWMTPLGLTLISQDLPFLQKPLLKLFKWIERKFQK